MAPLSSKHPSRYDLSPARLADLVTGLLTSAILLSQVWLIGDYQVDDAYISFAFAKNLANGHGLTYGAGLRVEGYSNFLWTVAAAGMELVAPQHLYLVMQGLALGCLALMLFYAYRLSARLANPFFARMVVLLTACATDLTGAALSALETLAYAAALTATVYYYLTERQRRRRASGWCFLLLALIRIDGIVHVAFFFGFSALLWLFERRKPRFAETARWLGLPVLVYASYYLARYAYYGLPLPTTYYAKSLIHELLPNRGLEYVLGAVNQLGLSVLGCFALLAVLWRRTHARSLLTLLIVFHLLYIRHVGGDWMPFHRFIVPILPLLNVLAGLGAFDLWQFARRRPWPLRVILAPALLGAAGYIALLQNAYSLDTPEELAERDSRLHTARHTHALVDAQRLFRWVTRAPGEKLVTDYGGVFGYYSDASIIEMWGLCNADIALKGNTDGISPIYGKTCIACYADFQPDYFHANVPLLRPIDAFHDQRGVLNGIFQADAIGRVLDLEHGYVTGRVVDRAQDKAFYFIERKRSGLEFTTRHPAPGIDVEYPFLNDAAGSR